MQTNAEHVYSKPGQTDHDIAENAHHSQAAFANEGTPTGVKNYGVLQYNQKRSIFFRVPAPESTPGLISPDSSKDRSDEAK